MKGITKSYIKRWFADNNMEADKCLLVDTDYNKQLIELELTNKDGYTDVVDIHKAKKLIGCQLYQIVPLPDECPFCMMVDEEGMYTQDWNHTMTEFMTNLWVYEHGKDNIVTSMCNLFGNVLIVPDLDKIKEYI
jgi:hypothetical protein